MLTILASYPKSGNTWLRHFIACHSMNKLVSINDIGKLINADANYDLWSEVMGLNYDIKVDEYFSARNLFFKKLSDNYKKSNVILKSHSAYVSYNGIYPLFNHEDTDKFVYVIRNPLDVLPSFAHHLGISIPDAWIRMKDTSLVLEGGTRTSSKFYEFASSWSRHVESWLEISQIKPDKFLSVRYEDMQLKPITTFGKIVAHIGFSQDENLLVNAISWSRFDVLKKEEEHSEVGFAEAAAPDRKFFRKGQIGSGREEVPKHIQDEMFELWEPLIRKLGYEALFGR